MHGVVLPQLVAMKQAMGPVGDEIFADQKDDHLRNEGQARQRAVAVFVEGDQAVGGGDVEQKRGAGDEHADAEVARDDRNEEPIAQVGDQIGLAPPRPPGIAGPKIGQHREGGGYSERDRNDLHKRLADADDECEQFLVHAMSRFLPMSGGVARRQRCALPLVSGMRINTR
jgi:hypothetical protein